jgi:uncharacterized membrane protein
MIKPIKLLFFISIFFISFLPTYSQDETSADQEQDYIEKIKQFHANILIKENGTIVVTETIQVCAAQQKINHGIFRALPRKNHSEKVSRNNFYTVLSVKKEGSIEPYHIDIDRDKYIIYIGDEDTYLADGDYTYTLTYEVEAQVHSYSDFDEIYWNITGNYWEFDIENISATVVLPREAAVLQTHCYTGVDGSKESECSASIKANVVNFKSKNLKIGEGFTVAVSFPKGVVKQPTFLPHYKMEEFLSLEKMTKAFLAIGICFLFYFFSWKKYGNDESAPANLKVIDLKSSFSPTALQYLRERSVNKTTLLTTIISLSVKGAIEIASNSKESWQDGFEYILRKGNSNAVITSEERAVLESIFKEKDTFTIDSKSYMAFDAAEKVLKKSLGSLYNIKEYYQGNGLQMMIGFFVTSTALWSYCHYAAGHFLGWQIFGCFCFVVASLIIIETYKLIQKREFGLTILMLLVLMFPSVFTYAAFFASNLDKDYSVLNVVTLFIIVIGFSVYLKCISRYTARGNEIKLQTDQLKQNLLNYVVEVNIDTVSVYEKNLAYAFALDIQQEWNLKFRDALNSLNYKSHWIISSENSTDSSSQLIIHFGTVYTSMSSSSESGSSGGGSSGGGGGGGGGGGW